jgi:hypothetical protein
MSHIVTITTQARDPVAIAAACRRLSLPPPVEGTTRLYAAEASGLIVQLPGWRYPLVLQPQTGQACYDLYEGHWGDPAELGRFLQAYACEKVRLEAIRQGQIVHEQLLDDGSVRLTLSVV